MFAQGEGCLAALATETRVQIQRPLAHSPAFSIFRKK